MLGHLMMSVMKFEYLKPLIFTRKKKAFPKKQKTFFLVSQVLSFRLKKQTCKNAADTTFNQKSHEKKVRMDTSFEMK